MRDHRSRLTVAQWFALSIGILVAVATAGVITGVVALRQLTQERVLTADRIDPAIATSLQLDAALLNEETGLRGYALTNDRAFLEPSTRGRAAERPLRTALLGLTRSTTARLTRELGALGAAADAWRTRFAEPVVADVEAGRKTFTRADLARGKTLFDRVRGAAGALLADLRVERATARGRLSASADRVLVIFVVSGVVLLLSVLTAAVTLRTVVVEPLRGLASGVREIADGAFTRRVEAGGAREVRQLAGDVDAMRERILLERDELRRSNAELEQFAYVASQDLQEPLRKIASFSQMLQRRYAGQLDERADTYIDFAVDGAKRMQDLINDLLAFSRVGRLSELQAVVDCNVLVERARRALGGDRGVGRHDRGLRAPRGLRRGVAARPRLLKPRRQRPEVPRGRPPHIRVSAECAGEDWSFTVADNGIGVEAEYADRIFVIFQRLHPRASYAGTGIGLAMCRKVIEYHGGRIWLDTEPGPGAVFHFILPAITEDQP